MGAEEKRLWRIWRFLEVVTGGALRRFFRFQGERVEPGAEPFLLVANHNTDLDPALVGLSFPKTPLYFVASEHVFRKGFWSNVLRKTFRPISRMKGTTDAAAAMEIIRALRKGRNVCLFPEGNRSFNGLTGPIFPATGKLAKASGAALITYKLEGGYLTSPRWSESFRKGRMLGYCVNVYTAEQLKGMTPEQVNAAIAADLFEDAFARQQTEPVAYRGRNLAEGLESALYICPRCGRIDRMKGLGNRFHCICGLTVTYTEYGAFAGEDAPFSNVRDWDAFQTARMEELAAALTDAPAFCDHGMQLIQVDEDHHNRVIATGTLSMDRRALTLAERSFPMENISGMALVGASAIVFTADAAHYEIRSESARYCGRKYVTLYEILRKAR